MKRILMQIAELEGQMKPLIYRLMKNLDEVTEVKKKRFEDEDDSAHTDSSADTLVIPSTSQVPKPPTVRGFPALQRNNAFCRSPNEKLNSSDQTDVILLAVAKCETRVEDQSRLLEQVMTLQKDILHQLQHTRPHMIMSTTLHQVMPYFQSIHLLHLLILKRK
ncbi:hypothetical protein Pmani_012283 [Petrolisthes manimaculis]|uniref:Uncharacterized protein n=1 Tax=Petrolisthes manimaculis TaxID=1843537 RepID=A0AAE1TVW4_9EUCA|nr:hypothetical protein Pmani_030470 [Petrolisthes manimaculis]KAK4316581.1 hypothetical protein Pmani_012283 [Petrolisthes manimaculis]